MSDLDNLLDTTLDDLADLPGRLVDRDHRTVKSLHGLVAALGGRSCLLRQPVGLFCVLRVCARHGRHLLQRGAGLLQR